jgi:uncharacterized protein (DUF1684 family)
MMRLILFVPIVILLSCGGQKSQKYEKKVLEERKEKNKLFSSADGPLEEKDRENFVSLNYFPVDTFFRIKAEYIPIDTAKPFEMPTSTDRTPLYIRKGFAKFEVEGMRHRLTIFENLDNPQDSLYFIPFSDLTSAVSTYGGGRYLDVKPPKTDQDSVLLDFNKAYNPYCAYNYNYSCPIPPPENSLDFSVRAGEKNYK